MFKVQINIAIESEVKQEIYTSINWIGALNPFLIFTLIRFIKTECSSNGLCRYTGER